MFSTTVSAANTGNATVSVGTVTNPSAWVPANYTLQFTSATDWQVVDDSTPTPLVIASGSGFTSGQSISFQGVSVTITGAPAANDSFGIAPAQNTDIFSMLDELARTLEGDGAIAGSNRHSAQIGAASRTGRRPDRVVVCARKWHTAEGHDTRGFRDSEEVD